MNRCPITYEPCEDKYSQAGLRLLSKNLTALNDFPFTPKELVQRAIELAAKLSIQGVQPKLSVRLNAGKQEFQVVEQGGTFILKPPHHIYEELPQNEDVTMKLAAAVNIETPLHGMIYNIDGSLSYIVKRFDRLPKGNKLAIEDFAQLLGDSRNTKYDSSMEKVVAVVEKHCTFPLLEKIKLFRRVLFNFLVGNEDMHLKNFSLIRLNEKVEMSPAYDLVNTTLVLKTKEEIALSIRGKKSQLTRYDIIEYFGKERLGLSGTIILKELQLFEASLESWYDLLQSSFLSPAFSDRYSTLIQERWKRIYSA
jgi:serine/threonine-protein kinase HipA